MDKRLIMIAVILVFGYIGVSSDSHGADTYNSMVPGFFDNAIDESKLFLVLLIVLSLFAYTNVENILIIINIIITIKDFFFIFALPPT